MARKPPFTVRYLPNAKGKSSPIVDLRLIGTNGEQSRVRAEQGFDMISIATDVDVLAQTYAAYMTSATGQSATVESGYSTK